MKAPAALLCLACSLSTAQQPAVFQSETQMVLVDAAVTDKRGEPVRDLTAKDFRIWEDGKLQTIRSFALETSATAGEPLRFLLLFDNSSMSVSNQVAARQAAAQFIDSAFADTSTGTNRLMAILNYDDGLRVAQNFSADPQRLKQALQIDGLTAAPATPSRGGVPPFSGPNSGAKFASAAGLVRNLSAAPGRKALILFMGNEVFTGLQNNDVTGLVQLSNRSNVAIYPVLQPTALLNPIDDNSGCGRSVFPARPQARVCLPTGTDSNQAGTLASGTGGFVSPPSNELLPELQKIEADQTRHYVLGYTPESGSKPEACHALRVKVDRPGVNLRVRSSYCAVKPQDLLAENRVEQDLEKHAAASQSGNAAASIEAPFFYVSPNVARVHVSMEIATGAMKFQNEKGKLDGEINLLGIAAAADGSVAARFSDVIKREFDSPQAVEAFERTPLHYEKEFKIVPGRYQLTVVFSSGGASFGKVEQRLAIPVRDPAGLAISGLALGTQLHPAGDLGLGSLLGASLLDTATPLIANGMQLTPAGSSALTKTTPAFCYFEVYLPGAGDAATLRVRILDLSGQPKWDGGTAQLETSGRSTVPVGLNLPIASLVPGSYRLEVTVSGATGSSAQQSAAFELH